MVCNQCNSSNSGNTCAINSSTTSLQLLVKTCWPALQKMYYCSHEDEVSHLSHALPIQLLYRSKYYKIYWKLYQKSFAFHLILKFQCVDKKQDVSESLPILWHFDSGLDFPVPHCIFTILDFNFFPIADKEKTYKAVSPMLSWPPRWWFFFHRHPADKWYPLTIMCWRSPMSYSGSKTSVWLRQPTQ